MSETTAVKERPILFSGPMVRAILDGRKSQTRRTVKPQPPGEWFPRVGDYAPTKVDRRGNEYPGPDVFGASDDQFGVRCPYGRPGDRLWVRETWASNCAPADETHPARALYFYRAGGTVPNRSQWVEYRAQTDSAFPGRWFPSIHMFRQASRLSLEITGIRCERLHAISEADARAEGCETEEFLEYDDWQRSVAVSGVPVTYRTLRSDYQKLWEKINGPGSWDANPWVWCIEFRRLDP